MPTTNPSSVYNVSGFIYDEHNSPLANAPVKLYDIDLRSEQLLGSTKTDAKGSYTITFNADAASPEYHAPDIQVRVYEGRSKLLGQSPIYFNIQEQTTIDYKLGGTAYVGTNEFDSLLQLIEPILKQADVKPGELQENDKHKDISFIAGETGEDAEKISFLNTAFALANTSKIAAGIFYGLLRMGFPAVLNELLMMKSESVRKAIKQSIDENIISSKWEKGMDKIIIALNVLSVQRIINGNDDQSTSFNKLFGSVFTEKQQAIFTSTYFDNEETPELFWDKLKKQTGFNDSAVKKAKQLLSFNLLTDNQPELAEYLFSNQSSDADLKDLSGYAKFTRADWQQQIKSAAVTTFPAWIKGETKKEKSKHFAESLEQLHKELYPVAFFSERMKQDDRSAFALKSQLNKFFKSNPDFELGIKNINKQLDDARYDNSGNKEALKKELKTINRLYKLTDDYKQVNALYGKQLFSSTDIVTKYGKELFVKQFANSMGSPEAAAMLYRKSVSINNKATALITAYKMSNDVRVYAINGNAPALEDYYEMFGDGELCECEHCQSVYSPAAYFVDMLAFIKRENESAYSELLRRRPDLEYIKLTCKNTNTPLPYIDLVNELLEQQVVKLSGISDTEGITALTHSYQTEGGAAELNAMPEHSSTNAYTPLKTITGDAVFSAQLPLDFPVEEIKLYTEKLGVNRYDLMEAFYGNNEPGKVNDAKLASAFLEFTNAELNSINGTSTFSVALPGTMNEVLDKTKLSYLELLQLLETYFLNPLSGEQRLITIKQEDEGDAIPPLLTCNLNKLFLEGADDVWLNKAIRFKRLWKKIGWDIFDLDRTLTVLGLSDFPATEAAFNEQLLIPFAHIEKIRRLLKIPLRQAITFFGDVDSVTYLDHSKEGQPVVPSLYQQLFQDKTVISAFPASPFSAAAENLSGVLMDHAETICAVLGITASELELLEPATDLTIQSISKLYRDVLLTRSLKETVADVQEIVRITGKGPATGIWSPVLLTQFLEEYHFFKSAGIKAEEYNSIIRNKAGVGYMLMVDGNLIDFVQQPIDALTEIKNDPANTEDERKEKYAASLELFLSELSAKDELIDSLAEDLYSLDDIALKNAVENFLGDKNKESLRLQSGDGLIEKLSKLKLSLSEYLFLKTTPEIFKLFRFSAEEVRWLADTKTATGTAILWDDLTASTSEEIYAAFKMLLQIKLLVKIKIDGRLSWTGLFDIAINNGAAAKAEWFEKFTALYVFPESSLVFLCGAKSDVTNRGQLNFSFPDDYRHAENILTILNCCRIIEKLGGNDDQLNALLNTVVLAEDAQAVKSLLKSKYGNEEWLDRIKPINDGLRTRRRDALVAWLLANTHNDEWHSSNDMYDWLLIDTEMDACMMTSRLKQGISSIQLFIDRCLMNLEKDASTTTIVLGTEFSDQWHSWRKQYRVWEANRKIFLYPENWIEPDLRDDKSPFFKELESQLKQNEVTEETAKEALIAYLQKLDTVANLEMVGLFNDEETKIVHAFGRTQNIPHQYFYRKLKNSVWTAWEKVDVDIEGDHILPVVWNGRLMLFWGLFTEKQEDQGTFITPRAGDPIPPPVIYLEMKLAWSEYKNGKWGAKKISKDFIAVKYGMHVRDHRNGQTVEYTEYVKKRDCSLSSLIDSKGLYIRLFIRNLPFHNSKTNKFGCFHFDYCNASPVPEKNNDIEEGLTEKKIITMPHIQLDGMALIEAAEDKLIFLKSGLYAVNSISLAESELFNNTPQKFRLLPSHHEIERDRSVVFSYSNKNKNFYAYSIQTSNLIHDDFSLDNAGAIISRRTVPSSSVPSSTASDSDGTMLLHSSAHFGDVFNSELLNNENQFIQPHRQLYSKKYKFQLFYHPFVCSYIESINLNGIDDLYSKEKQDIPAKAIFTHDLYNPTSYVLSPYPQEEMEFSLSGAYSLYNWELFFHAPLLIATRLTQNQKFEQARKWFHYIFDPTGSSNGEMGVERFWITKPFRKEIGQNILSLEDLLNLDVHADDLEAQLTNWENNPFNPHAVARLRVSAYMRNTVLRYIENLIQWGDQLFARDTIESINEATLLYILASNILGKKQESVPARAKPVEDSFSDMKGKFDRFSNVKAEIESFISPSAGNDTILMPYFCLPKNDYLLKYWDTVADRLFKIRHCMNIDGVVRQLPLFEPPIDPSLLVRATAAGLDLNAILGDMNVVLPNYRFQVMLNQANELCNDVKYLGNSFLSALEKKDGEELALLRSSHERRMLEVMKDVKEKQRDEARGNYDGLLFSRIVIEERHSYYSKNILAGNNESEKEYFNKLWDALFFQELQQGSNAISSVLYQLPDITTGAWSWGITTGGRFWGASAAAAGNVLGGISSYLSYEANKASTKGSFSRRMDDWKFQSKTAELELKQIDKQILAAEIRLAIAEKEIENHALQMEQSREVDDYMRSKFTNAELYDWMVGQLATVYFQSYQLAYSVAKKAEKCLQHELGLDATSYVQFGYWDSLKKGLLSGDKLQYDLRRLGNAYLEENKREYEIVKHVSLIMLDPLALIKLRSTGACDFEIPEALYDMDHADHYFRRLKSVSVSLPCIAGPYTSVSAKLSLGTHKYRKSNVTSSGYEEAPGVDERFVYKRGSAQSIATSSAQNDSGVFELNFRDERYLPFEGTGAISSWTLELPTEIRQFDYNTISDVILHVKYTAKDGGLELKNVVKSVLHTQLENIAQSLGESGLHLALNLKHDLPNEWHILKRNNAVDLVIDKSRLPYMAQPFNAEIESVMFIAKIKNNPASFQLKIDTEPPTNFSSINELQLWTGINLDIEIGRLFNLSITPEDIENLEELMLVIKYKF